MKDFYRLHTFLTKGPDRRETSAYVSSLSHYLIHFSKKHRNRDARRCDSSLARKILKQFAQE